MALLEGLTSVVVALCTFYLFSVRRRKWNTRNPKNLPTPPGPKGLPLVGNVLEIPMVKPWAVYNQWSKEYGSDIVYFTALDKSFLVLNSLPAVQDLLVRRSEKYSDRPRLPMICEVYVHSLSKFLYLVAEWPLSLE
ncbi:hypothetical protein P691DRAFT_672159 [Macrolepiota fuliginosa MF-IS2]|uniref:Cytochrome P450 n=1 Tax=Macrolepiota fuliginosa MF-IS2 TaxID=1400762 RepID=A0A9P5XAI9_9AGAR|nr:hypothetical protein P691DRAFT_672159 [Macrolepiota fuliginosa MF-IS2]